MGDFGDFEEIKEEEKPAAKPAGKPPQKQHGKFKGRPQEVIDPNIPQRVRQPRENQKLGVVVQRLGGNRMSIKTTDNKVINCRVPGRFKRKFWLRPGDAVLIEPWELDAEQADIVYQYKGNELFQLRKRGYLDAIKDGF